MKRLIRLHIDANCQGSITNELPITQRERERERERALTILSKYFFQEPSFSLLYFIPFICNFEKIIM